MSYSIVICLCVALILILSVFFLGMVYFLNLGLKLAEKGAQPVSIIPKKPRPAKKTKEQIEREAEMEAFEKMIDEYHGHQY